MAKHGKPPYCPLIQKDCKEHRCAWYVNVLGTNPQTGETVDNWQCAITAIPMLQIEQARASHNNHAATVEVREAVHKASQATVMAALGQIQPAEIHVNGNGPQLNGHL